MEIVKKNLISIICGVICLLAVASLFFPISGLYDTLSKDVDSRISVNSSIESLISQQRTMPQLSPDEATPPALTVFPTDAITQTAQDATNKVKDEANAMLQYVTNINKHLLLIPDELPKPSDFTRYNFANTYAANISNYSRWQQMLDSAPPPSPADIQAAKDKLKEEIYKQRLQYNPDGSVDQQSQQDADAQYDIEAADLQPKMELDAAKGHRVYMLMPPTANVLPIDPNIKVSSEPTPEQICDAQVVIWVLDDVCHAIAQANDLYADPASAGGAPEHDILHSPIKRIEGIDAPVPVLGAQGAVDTNAGVTSLITKVPTASPSGRTCNGLYDVVQFKMRLVVDVAKIPQIVKALEMGQFITVNNVQILEMVDPAAAASDPNGGYRYGTRPVARVEFDCEELLMRTWTDPWLPDDRKGGLGKSALGQPTDNGGAGGPPMMGGPPQYGPPGGPPPPMNYAPPR